MKIILIFLVSYNIFASQVFLIPDENNYFSYWIKKDLRTAKNIEIVSSEFSSQKIFRLVRKFANRDEVLARIILDKNRQSIISKLKIYKNIEIFQLSGLQNSEMNLNFIIIDKKILYLLSNPLTKKGLNQNYGFIIRTKNTKMIEKFLNIFNITIKRSLTKLGTD